MSRRSVSRAVCRGLLVVLGWGLLVSAVWSADHRDAPLLLDDGRTDLNDVYVFASPEDARNTVLVMTVNPFAGILSPFTLDPAASYDFLVDNDGDAVEDLTFRLTFGEPDASGRQSVLLTGTPRPRGVRTEVLARGLTEQTIKVSGGGKLRVDLHDDPFFFDLAGFQAGLNFTGMDFFAGANVTAIILELPNERLGGRSVSVWTRTEINGVQIDRNGRPAINTVLIPPSLKDAFNAGQPRNDVRDFFNTVVGTLLALGNNQTTAEVLAAFLLPDVNTFSTGDTGGFPNGRRLADDVIDTALNLLVPHDPASPLTDGVDANDREFLGVFPYLAPPHE